jgi:uridine kinase
MPAVLPGYATIVAALKLRMRKSSPMIITIDGPDGVGKTTLGRYLAWHFGVTLIESDLFVIPTKGYPIYLDDQVNRIIERRLSLGLPVIVEGISIQQLMRRLNRTSDFSIYLKSPKRSRSRTIRKSLADYEEAFNPTKTSSLVIQLEH